LQKETSAPYRTIPLSLVLDGLTALGDAGEDVLTVLVHVELGDNDVGGGDGNGDALAVALVAGDLLDVDDELETVGRSDLAFTALLGPAGDRNVVADTDGDGADLLVAELDGVVSGWCWA
jgi:hypothetical protein